MAIGFGEIILGAGGYSERKSQFCPRRHLDGFCLAMILSYDRNHSIFYAFVHVCAPGFMLFTE